MRFSFGDCSLDLGRRELRRQSKLVGVEPQVFDILVFLLRNRDRVVERNELRYAIWGRRIVSESTFSSRIASARSAIGDTDRGQRLIRTLSRKGLRFVAEVTEAAERTDHPEPIILSSCRDGKVASEPSRRRLRLAVLPFVVIGDNPQAKCFARGLFEETIAALSRVSLLDVSTLAPDPVRDAGKSDADRTEHGLTSDYVLSGIVQRAGDTVRLVGRLVTEGGAVLWSERLEGTIGEAFELQDAFTLRFLGAVMPRLEVAEIARARKARPGDLSAYDLYLRALGSPWDDRVGYHFRLS